MQLISKGGGADNSDDETVRSVIRRLARERGTECFLIDPRRDEAVSFEECHSAVLNFARALQNVGARKGDKVTCMVSNGRSAVEFLLGTMYGGQVAVPLNGAAGSASLAASLEHSDAQFLFVDADHRRVVDEVIVNLAHPPTVLSAKPASRGFEGGENELPHLDLEDDALLAYTSGSTGRPKGVLVSHRNLLSGGWNTVKAHRLTSCDRSLCVLPLYHMNAQVVTLMSTLLSGGSVVVPERFQTLSFWELVEKFRCTWFSLAPTIVSQLVQNALARALDRRTVPECVRFARCSSAPLAPELHQRFEELFELPLIEAMGSTEAGGAIFSNPLPPARRKPGSPGLPVGFEMRVVDQAGSDLRPGQTGEILVRGPSVMKGYYKDPAATAEVKDADGWLRTGDLGFCDHDGYVRIVGRSKEIIIKGGENVAPREIDEVLLAHPTVLEAAAVGIPDSHLGEEIIAYVVLKFGEQFRESDLLAWCRKKLGSIKTPSLILPVDSLPRGPTGKVLRRQLAESANHRRGLAPTAAQSATLPPSGGSVEALVLGVWEGVLGLRNIGAQDNFFRLGGHSLLAMEVLIQFHQLFGVGFSFGFFFEHATPTCQAWAITEELKKRGLREDAFLQGTIGGSQNERTIPLRDRSVPCPLSPVQRSIWFLEQLHPGLPLYVESRAIRIRGQLDTKVVEAALSALVARHEMLRTAIRAVGDGSPAQFVEAEVTVPLRKISCHDNEEAWPRLLHEETRRTFDLSVAPLLRASLIETAPNDYVLSVVLHHIACDGYSLGVFFTELCKEYRELIVGKSYAPPPLPIQYGDYAAWKCSEGRSEKVQRDILYWKARLEGVADLLSWQIGFPRPAHSDYKGASIPLHIPAELTEKLRDLSQGEGVSLFTVVVAAFEVLLHRLCGQAKFLLGIPVAHREKPELMPLIGNLVELLVLPADFSCERTFRQYVRDVDAQIREMYVHDAVPFDTLVQELGVERGPSHEPLVQVILNWRISSTENLLLPGLKLSHVPVHNGCSKFDLSVSLCDGPGGLDGSVGTGPHFSVRRQSGN